MSCHVPSERTQREPDRCCRYDMYKHIDERQAAKRGRPYTDKFVDGLPVGLKLPNGITIGGAHEDGVDGVQGRSHKLA